MSDTPQAAPPAAAPADGEPSVLLRVEGRAAFLAMNRPKVMNALDEDMIARLHRALERCRDDPAVSLVVLEGAGGRAFCAGGDVRAVRRAVLDGDGDSVRRFFADEYALNRAIAEFAKPWISIIDGVCMGGGLGVSVHGSHRVVSEHALLAMPETAIALFPDVGTSYVLPRLPGAEGAAVGNWLAMTGARLRGAEAVEAGLATHFVPREALPALREALRGGDPAAVEAHARPVRPAGVEAQRAAIGRCFSAGHVADILRALAGEDTEWSREALATLRRMSPTSLCVTRELLRRGAALDLGACLDLELALTGPVTAHPDFAEGVRAVLVDKGDTPRWSPPTLEQVDEAAVRAMFGG